jgi:hypothetical protein
MTETSKHSGGRRKAVRRPGRSTARAGAAAPAKPSGGARVKAPEPVRRGSGPSRFAGARTARGAVLIGAGVIVLAFVLRWAATRGGGDDETGGTSPVGPALTTYGADWKAKDGSSYRLTVTPIAELVRSSSGDGCIAAAGPGRTNLRFTVRVDNRGTSPAPVPDLEFAVNTKASGVISKRLSFEKASKLVDVTPTTATDCAHASRVTGAGRDEIAPQSAATFAGLLGGVKTPVGPGLTLIVRYSQADAGSPTGMSSVDVPVLYPDMRALS